MRICHCVQVAPNRCGLYGTARDLIKSEQAVGMEAGLIDANVTNNEMMTNGFIDGYPKVADPLLPVQSVKWADAADVYFRHSFIPVQYQNLKKPLVMAIHGRPESSFRLECANKIPVISEITKRSQKDDRYKAFVTFWPEYYFAWSTIIPKEKLFYVQAPVDLEYYKPGEIPYDLKEHKGDPNILIADIWREDILPFNVLLAASLFQQKYCPSAKIHVLALQGKELQVMAPILAGIKSGGGLGAIAGQVKEINQFYAATDIVVTPHTIATRIVREALSSGVPVVAGSGNRYTPYTANPNDIDAFARSINDCWTAYKEDRNVLKKFARQIAEVSFNPVNTGTMIKEILEKLV